ncbi:MAG TPA: alpha/beta hydrolase [Burkholderiales bacterium]|nr:alpha/beta hydrolase [Burkholderiales bacterium]
MAAQDKAAILASLPVRPDEDPFSVTIGGFYRRWFNLVDDLQALIDTVATIKSTEDEDWVPAWSAVAERFENIANEALARGDKANARRNFLEAKTFYSLARFPAPYHGGSAICPPDMSPIKAESYQKYLNCFHKATALRDEPQIELRIKREGKEAVGYLRLPKGASAKNKVPAVLVMCGGDMYKEDREKYADGANKEGLAALVVDAPGTGQTTFAHSPEAIVAWQAALDAMQSRPEIDGNRLGAFGVSRGGLWVMRLGAQDRRIKGLISCAPGGVGYWGTDEERAEIRRAAFERYKTNWFGPHGTKPEPREMTEEDQRKEFLRWSLKDNGLLDNLTMPMFLVNGKVDHLTPIGNLYMALESGPPTGRVARVYPDDGHIAARNEREWGPAAWKWLRGVLTEGMKPAVPVAAKAAKKRTPAKVATKAKRAAKKVVRKVAKKKTMPKKTVKKAKKK